MPLLQTNYYTIKLWYPSTTTYALATYSLSMKAPEIGNTENKARNQTMQRTRAGRTLVYDRGINYNEVKKLQFKEITDVERAQLLIFLEAVQWGKQRLKMQDYKGDEYIVRVNSSRIEYKDGGFIIRQVKDEDIVLWDFDLDILDLTNTSDESGESPPVSSALGLHLADFNDPHNPQTSITLNIADGAKVIESWYVRDWKAVQWLAVADKTSSRLFKLISSQNNGFGTTDATTVNTAQTTLDDTASIASVITFTVVLSGTGATQIMTLKAATSTDGYAVRVRRVKLS